MNVISPRQVAILYNKDGHVTQGDPQDLLAIQCTITATQNLYKALTGLGYQVVKIPVKGNLKDLEDRLSSFPPNETFIFNNCDGFNGNNLGAVQVIRLIERMGFKHTGAKAMRSSFVSTSRSARRALKTLACPPRVIRYSNRPRVNSCWSFQ